jgi:glucosamine-6-phosphate deaminase
MRRIPAGTADLRLSVRLADDGAQAAAWVADETAALIRARAAEGRRCVLLLPTGSTPLAVYRRLIELHRAGLSFRHVVTFNLDEYHGLAADDARSYHRFMHEHLFRHLDIPAAQIHLPRGDLAPEEVPAHAHAYEQAIANAGGIDLCLLGIGRNGHIAFNEPGSARGSRTRLAWLDRTTRRDAARDFGGEPKVPRGGVSVGVGTILSCRRILLLALGEGKAVAVAAAAEGAAGPQVPASWLQDHADAELVLDPPAAAKLTCAREPWRVGEVVWDERSVRAAVVRLSQAVRKPILSLGEDDYEARQIHGLVAARGPVHDLNVGVFRALTATITGWPGGKPPERRRPGDIIRPRDEIFPKRVLVLSPHPDDDVIAMGGTLMRLVDHGHEVHVAVQTSGNTAVSDDDLRRHLEFAAGTGVTGAPAPVAVFADPAQVRRLKGLIRRTETLAAGRECGVPAERVHFLDLPFYERRGTRPAPLGDDDIDALVALLRLRQPHQLYACGDLHDPHGTHRLCLEATIAALRRCQGDDWLAACEVWLYRGAWDDWEPHEVDMAVPLSPADVVRKRHAILRHQTQKDRAMFPGDDAREFWQRAEDRNRATAQAYDALGLAQYAAVEAFVRWSPA